MSAFAELGRALIGWLDLLAARPEATGKFNQTRRGLLIAILWYAVAVLLTIAAQTLATGFPGIAGAAFEVFVNAASLAGLWLVIWLSGRLLGDKIAATPMLVPAAYALAFMLIVGLPILMTSGATFSGAILGALGFMLFRLARQIGGLKVLLSLAFMLVCLGVLVGLPVALYMLATRGQGIA